MMINSSPYKKRLGHFSKSIFQSCKNMKKDTRILVLYWQSLEDKAMISQIAKKLRELDFLSYTIGFASIKIILTSRGKARVDKKDGWYDEDNF